MPTVIRSVHNTLTTDIIMSHTNVVIPASSTVDLFTIVSDAELLQIQSELAELVASGSLIVVQSDNTSEVLAGGFDVTEMTTTARNATFVAASLVSQGVTYTSKLAGTVGNSYSVTVIDSGSGHLSYMESAGHLTINLGGDTVTAAQVVTLIGTTTPSAFVNVSGTVGSVLIHAVQSLSGGLQSAVEGTLIYNTTTHKLNIFTTTWEAVTSA